MNLSQANLYEILDGFGFAAKVGKGTFTITKPLPFNNGVIDVNLKITGLHIFESDKSMYAIMAIGDLGIIAKAKNAALEKVVLFNLADPVPKFYIGDKDYTALLTHMEQDNWKSKFIVEIIDC